MITFKWISFSDLAVDQLYALLRLRAEVFVVEQRCAYLDLDNKDSEALHLLGMENNQLAAYLRLFPPRKKDHVVVFGRVATATTARSKGYGKKLMETMLAYCHEHFPQSPIQGAAQAYLQTFYESFGFKTIGPQYEEDGIPHIDMQKNPGCE